LPSARTGFVILIVAVIGAGVVATQLKRSPSYLQAVRLSQRQVALGVPGSRGTVIVGFSTKRADTARVSIQSISGRTVRVLGPAKPTRPYHRVNFAWRPTDAAGRPVNPGYYFVRIELLRSHRDLVLDDQSVRVRSPVG
jgi:flagellar hook assembly protein FlgD